MSSGRLTETDEEQLETWIGGGPKAFTLLYSITRDGCDVATFHQKCDNKGPTVTVLYTPQGSVYGGFASVDWQGTNGWSVDKAAFLFQLTFSGVRKCNKFPAKLGSSQITLGHTAYGPVFGVGGDLNTFSFQIPHTNGIFKLNGNMSTFGNNFDALGLRSADINNGTMDVTELEVYKVTDGARQKTADTQTESGCLETAKCWRKIPDWNQQLAESLCKELGSYQCPVESAPGDVRILLLGRVGSGKSAFVNTVQSAFSGRLRQIAQVGISENSFTTQYKPYRLRTRSGGNPNIRLCDIPGVRRGCGLDVTELGFLLDGNIPEQYIFHPSVHCSTRSAGFVYKPPQGREVHCVALLVDSAPDIDAETADWLKTFTRIVNERSIPLAILLTKIDLTCPTLTEDLSVVFKSQAIETKVNKASSIFGVPRNNVWPVKNYENEARVDDDVTILSLLALQRLVHLAEDYIEGQEIGITERDEGGNGRDHAGETVESDTA